MSNRVPPRIFDDKLNVVGISPRETVILGATLLIVISVVAIPLSWAARLSIAILLGLGGVGFAFLRTKSGYTLDEVFWFWLQFVSRDRHWARGAQPTPAGLPGEANFAIFPWFVSRPSVSKKKNEGMDVPAYPQTPSLLVRAAWQRELAAFLYAGRTDGEKGDWSFRRLARSMYSPKAYFMLANVMVHNGFFCWVPGEYGARDDLVCVNEDMARKRIRTMRLQLPPNDPAV